MGGYSGLPSAPTDMIDYIQDWYHRSLRAELPDIARSLSDVIREYGDDRTELYDVGRAFERVKRILEDHVADLDSRILPMLSTGVPLGGPHANPCQRTAGELMRRAKTDLDGLTGLFGELRRITFDYSAEDAPVIQTIYDMLRELEAETTRHLFIELQLLPKALADHPGGATRDGGNQDGEGLE